MRIIMAAAAEPAAPRPLGRAASALNRSIRLASSKTVAASSSILLWLPAGFGECGGERSVSYGWGAKQSIEAAVPSSSSSSSSSPPRCGITSYAATLGCKITGPYP